jgi:hypothetical protein
MPSTPETQREAREIVEKYFDVVLNRARQCARMEAQASIKELENVIDDLSESSYLDKYCINLQNRLSHLRQVLEDIDGV